MLRCDKKLSHSLNGSGIAIFRVRFEFHQITISLLGFLALLTYINVTLSNINTLFSKMTVQQMFSTHLTGIFQQYKIENMEVQVGGMLCAKQAIRKDTRKQQVKENPGAREQESARAEREGKLRM